MAFSKSLPKGQIPVGCQLCEGGHKIDWKCTDCNLLMCDRCKTKVHLKIAKDHRIVNIREIGEVEDSWDSFSFSDIKCHDHSSQSCSLYCKTCSKVICLKCIIKAHNGHTFVDEEEFEEKKMELKEGQKKVQSNLSKLSSEKEKRMAPEETENQKLNQIKQNILDQKKKVFKAVEQYADHLVQDISEQFRTLKNVEKNKIDEGIKEMHEKKEILENIITSKDFMTFFRDFDQLRVALNEDMPEETIHISPLPIFFPGEFTGLNFGTLEGSSRRKKQNSPAELTVLNQWTTELKHIHYIAGCPDETLWIADNLNEVLQHIKVEKDNVKALSTFSIKIFGIVYISDSMLVSTGETRLKLIDTRTHKMTVSCFDIAPLISRDVHITPDKKIIITGRSAGPAFIPTGRRVVFVMDIAGNRLIEYEYDSDNKPFFIAPYKVRTTRNGNICVVDRTHSDGSGRVVVIGEEEKTIGIYTGHHEVDQEKPFKLTDVISTPSDNIIAVDTKNHLFHILQNDGDFISYFKLHDIGIKNPYCLALSNSYNLLIGCTGVGVDKESLRAKVYEVEYSGIV